MTEKDRRNACSSKLENYLFSYLLCFVTGKLVRGYVLLHSKSNPS